MKKTKYDLLGIGNAIVDIIAYANSTFLKEHGFTKGAMTLIDEKVAARVYKAMGAATECAGGSAANTLAGFAMLGGSAAFIGKVRSDPMGIIFCSSLKNTGVDFVTPAVTKGSPTASCLVVVTEEVGSISSAPARVERTMATHLGIAGQITENDISEELIESSKILYFEGYLWDSEIARKAIQKAIAIAQKSGTKIAFTLSDPFCVDRHRADFLDLVECHVDILFANEHEIESLYQETDIRKILYRVSGQCEPIDVNLAKKGCHGLEIAAITRSDKGSYILANNSIYTIEAERVEDVYDVTGAGDLYAAGFLYGYVNGFGLEKSGQLGSMCAAEVIRYLGGRPATDISKLLEYL